MASRHSPAENCADVIRVLAAVALLAWLSTWADVAPGSRIASHEQPAPSTPAR